MKNHGCYGFLICFLLLMLQNVVAQTPDFSKMTRQQQQEYIKKMQQQQERLKQQLLKQFSESPVPQKQEKETGSVFITFKRTVLHKYNETKTENGTVNTQSGNSTININVNLSSNKVVLSDEGNSFGFIAYGDQQPGSIPLNGAGELSDEEEGQTDLSNSKSKGSISLDLANAEVSFDYLKDSKKGQLGVRGAYINPSGNASVHYLHNTSSGGDISATYMNLLNIMGTTYGNLGVYTYDVMEQAYKNMTPDQIKQYHNAKDMAGNGGICTVLQTKKGYEISYINSATYGTVDDGWTGTNTYTISTQVHMSVGEKPVTLDAIIEPLDIDAYNKFIPKGEKVDGSTSKGNTIGFHVKIVDKSDPAKDISGEHPFTVIYTLDSVSNYQGVCMNYPAKGVANDKPDLKWDDLMKSFAHLASIADLTATSKKKEGASFPAYVTSMDYGAYGVLKAHVILNNDDDLGLEAHFPDRPGEIFVRIPKDDNGNKIADEWEVRMGIFDKNHDPKWDEDDQMGQMRAGDGLTMFEEYRGFKTKRNIIVQGSKEIEDAGHVRTDPSHKDIFIYDPDDLIKRYYEAYNPANMCLHYINKEDMNFTGKPLATDNRWINFNYVSDYNYARQYVMCARQVAIADNDPNCVGATVNDYSLAGQPPNWKQIWTRPVFRSGELEVSPTRCLVTVDHLIAGKIIKPEDRDKVIKNFLTSTIIHEMGHYMGIIHHRFPENRKPVNEKYNSLGTDDPDAMSGNISCPMRYGTYKEYQTRDSWLTLYTNYCRKNMTGFRIECVEDDAFSVNTLRLSFEDHCDFNSEIIAADDCWGQIDIKTDPSLF